MLIMDTSFSSSAMVALCRCLPQLPSPSSPSSWMLSEERMLGDRERPELGVDRLSEEVRRCLRLKSRHLAQEAQQLPIVL